MRLQLLLIAILFAWGCSSAPAPLIPPMSPELAQPATAKTDAAKAEDEDDGFGDDDGFGEDPLADADMQQDVEDAPATEPEKKPEDKPAEGESAKPKGDTTPDTPAEPPKR